MEMAMAIGERVEKEGMQSMGDVLERSLKQEGHKDRVCLRQLEEIMAREAEAASSLLERCGG